MRVFLIKHLIAPSNLTVSTHPTSEIQLLRRFSSIEKCLIDTSNPNNAPTTAKDTTFSDKDESIESPQQPEKIIKVAVIGAPNAGKSSFINSITNHRVNFRNHHQFQ